MTTPRISAAVDALGIRRSGVALRSARRPPYAQRRRPRLLHHALGRQPILRAGAMKQRRWTVQGTRVGNWSPLPAEASPFSNERSLRLWRQYVARPLTRAD